MCELLLRIEEMDDCHIGEVLEAVLHRYADLFPDWEISVISLCKCEDRSEQLDRMIAVLEKMKEYRK